MHPYQDVGIARFPSASAYPPTMRAGTLALIGALIGLVATAPMASPAGAEQAPASRGALLVSMSRAGGLKPVDDLISIRTNGRGRVVAGFGTEKSYRHFRLPRRKLASLRDLVNGAELTGGASPPTCADCYAYVIKTRSGRVTFNDADLVDDADGPEVSPGVIAIYERLTRLLSRHQPQPPM